jgi:hypothetical protein
MPFSLEIAMTRKRRLKAPLNGKAASLKNAGFLKNALLFGGYFVEGMYR